jgi:uncharacterized protein (DUF1499 family)
MTQQVYWRIFDMGLFSGKRPQGLGFHAGGKTAAGFKPCSWKPNCINSTADQTSDAAHYIEPLKIRGDAAKAWTTAVGLIKAAPRTTVVTESATYLYAEVRSKAMGYVDDVELALDAAAKVIHVRSAARLGVRDFGVNRSRIESLRSKLAAAPLR